MLPAKKPRLLRATAYVAVPALALAGLVATTTTTASAATPDPRPTAIGADWLAGELTDGLLFNPNFGGFDDYGLSIDAGLALAAVDGHDDDVQAVADAIAANLSSYTSYPVTDEKTHVSAGSVAKALAFAQVAGRDGGSYGGQDLVAQLEDRVSTEAATAGRIGDVFFPEEPFESDFSNTVGQGFAARGLTEAGSPSAGSVTDYLLAQQCDEGFFRLGFSAPDAADQTCDGDTSSTGSVDTTALVLLDLADQAAADPAVATAIVDGLDWLESVQAADGSFGSDDQITDANANSTGVAGWALGDLGRTGAAEDAAAWVRARQADDPAACRTALTPETGAIAYDDTALAGGRADGITDDASDQFRRATAQALPALDYAPAAATASPVLTQPSDFRRAGARESLGGSGFAEGSTVCFTGPGTSDLVTVPATGSARTPIQLPIRTGDYTYRATNAGASVGTVTFRALARKSLPVAYKKRPATGTNQRAVVSGLAAGESVTVTSRRKVVARGTANDAGRFVARFAVGDRSGKAGLSVRGEFGNRKASRAYIVVDR